MRGFDDESPARVEEYEPEDELGVEEGTVWTEACWTVCEGFGDRGIVITEYLTVGHDDVLKCKGREGDEVERRDWCGEGGDVVFREEVGVEIVARDVLISDLEAVEFGVGDGERVAF